MTVTEARELFDYAAWATARMLGAIERLPPDRAQATAGGSFSSIAATLAHMVGAEWLWLRRWLGEAPTSLPEWLQAPAPIVSDLAIHLAAIEADRERFLVGLTDDDLDRTLSYRTLDGRSFSLPLGKLLRHVVNHSTYHRGQVATLLRQAGEVPPSADFALYLIERQAERAASA